MTDLAQNGNDKPATLAINWSYSYRNTWSGTIWYLKQVPKLVVTIKEGQNGAFKLTYSLSKTVDLTTVNNESLKVSLDVKKDSWKATQEAEQVDDSVWEMFKSIFTGTEKVGSVPDYVKENTIDNIDFSFDFGALRFFTLTNILRK